MYENRLFLIEEWHVNEYIFRIMGLENKIEKNKSLSKKLKALAAVCLFFSFCYCYGSASIKNVDRSEGIATNVVWIVSIIALVGIFLKDSQCIKTNKATKFDIYRLEVEELNTKKEVARITGNGLPDYMYDKQIDAPDGTITLPIAYYGVLVGIDIMIRIWLLINHGI